MSRKQFGSLGGGGGTGAPSDADYIVNTTNATLSAERVLTDSTSIVKNVVTPGQVTFERAALTGDVTATANSNATTIAANAVTNAKLADMAANTVKVNATAGSADPSDLALTASTIVARGSSGNVAACILGPGLTFSGAVLTPSVYWDGTNLRNASATIIDGIYTAANMASLGTATAGLAGIVTDPGGNAAVPNTTIWPWSVYANGTKWDVMNGSAILARMTAPIKPIRPAITFDGAYTTSDNGGLLRITSAGGAHGLTAAIAVGKHICVLAGHATTVGIHEIASLDIDTTGTAITLTTTYNATHSVTSITHEVADEFKVWEVTIPALRAYSTLIVQSQVYGITPDVDDKVLNILYGGTEFREMTVADTTAAISTTTHIMNSGSTSLQFCRAPRANNTDGATFTGDVVTGTVNSATTQTLGLYATFVSHNEPMTVWGMVEVIW